MLAVRPSELGALRCETFACIWNITLTNVLFVCTGNICRSPTAEGVFRTTVERAGMQSSIIIDSAGTHDYHLGSPPDPRAVYAAALRGYDIAGLRARRVSRQDFAQFDWVLAMDRANLRVLEKLKPASYHGNLALFLDLAPGMAGREVPDPYCGGAEDFTRVIDLVEIASEALLERVSKALPRQR
jgi:protein-tyrosine phosphatase